MIMFSSDWLRGVPSVDLTIMVAFTISYYMAMMVRAL